MSLEALCVRPIVISVDSYYKVRGYRNICIDTVIYNTSNSSTGNNDNDNDNNNKL